MGAVTGELRNLVVSSATFRPGTTLRLSVQVYNPASVPLTGSLQLHALNSLDQLVADFTIHVADLPAGASLDIMRFWDTSGLPNGDYKILAYMNYESSASEPLTAWASTYRRVYLPLIQR